MRHIGFWLSKDKWFTQFADNSRIDPLYHRFTTTPVSLVGIAFRYIFAYIKYPSETAFSCLRFGVIYFKEHAKHAIAIVK